MNKVFNKIKEEREKLGLTQQEFATAAGVNRSDVSKLERGEKKFIDIAIVQFLNSKGVDLNELFGNPIKKAEESPEVLNILKEQIKVLKESLRDKERIIKLQDDKITEPEIKPEKTNKKRANKL